MGNLFYTLSDGCDIIYVSDNLNDVIKTGVEWFFSPERFSTSNGATPRIACFKRGKLYDEPPRYGEEVVKLNFREVPTILKGYSAVPDPNEKVIEVLNRIANLAKTAAKDKLMQINEIDAKQKELYEQRVKILSDVQDLYRNELIRTDGEVEMMPYEEQTRQETAAMIRERQEDEKRKGAVFGTSTELKLQFVDESFESDDLETKECYFCKTQENLYFLDISEDARRGVTLGHEEAFYYAYLCCGCVKENLASILAREKKLIFCEL